MIKRVRKGQDAWTGTTASSEDLLLPISYLAKMAPGTHSVLGFCFRAVLGLLEERAVLCVCVCMYICTYVYMYRWLCVCTLCVCTFSANTCYLLSTYNGLTFVSDLFIQQVFSNDNTIGMFLIGSSGAGETLPSWLPRPCSSPAGGAAENLLGWGI